MRQHNTDLGAARAGLVDILHQRAFLLSVPLAPLRERNHASDQRKAERVKQLGWISPQDALYIAGTDNPAELETALKSGRVRCRFRHAGRWWQWKDVPDAIWKAVQNGARMIGADGRSLVDSEQWMLQVNEDDWREHLGLEAPATQPAAPAPAASEPTVNMTAGVTENVQLRNAPEAEIRNAVRAEYDQAEAAGRKPPNINELQPRVQERLKTKRFRASGRRIAGVGNEKEFEDRRLGTGHTWKSKKVAE